jgi:hypothetical protein
MRFIEDGPDIPSKLLRKWRDGEVVFLAGAGVSRPCKLPLFDELAISLYEGLNDSLFGVLRRVSRCKRAASVERIMSEAVLSPRQHVEAELYIGKQLDRLFSAVESRIDYNSRGRPISRRVRDEVEAILRRSTGPQSGHRDLLRLSTENASGTEACRIVTTNFDLLFEEAWTQEFSSTPRSYDARIAPRPGAHDFSGIIHLHGMLGEDSSKPGQFVLSSRDFSRTYLRSGVVANYVYDLIRKYTIVLVGYSADDPPMRYLMDAVGEDASLFNDMQHPYVIGDRQNSELDVDGAIAVERWRAKRVEPILFGRRPDGDPYGPLWETFSEWANWQRQGMAWVRQQLQKHTQIRVSSATPFSQSYIENLLAQLDFREQEDALFYLRDLRPDFGWFDHISAGLAAAEPEAKDR